MLRYLRILYKIPFKFATFDTIDLMWLLSFNLFSKFIHWYVERVATRHFELRECRTVVGAETRDDAYETTWLGASNPTRWSLRWRCARGNFIFFLLFSHSTCRESQKLDS